MIDRHQLYKRLIGIPFLDLGPIPNFANMKQESLQAYASNQLLTMNSRNPVDDTYLNLSVEGVFDYKGLPEIASRCDSCLPEYQIRGKMHVPFVTGQKTIATQFSKQVPLLKNYIADLLDHPGRARFSVLNAHTDVGWHSHYYGKHRIDHTELTLHIVLSTNHNVLAQVGRCDFAALDEPGVDAKEWFKDPEQVYSTHFTEGRLWLLNSRHSHRFTNTSDQERVHTWITTYFFDHQGNPVNENLYRIIQQAVDDYSGVIID
jgi:hypothetical protein